MEHERRIAVMIDAENVSPKYIRFILDEIATHGTPTYKRIYGDWTSQQQASWKELLLEYSITPIQQYSYTSGKNATDSCLIIDAMDILYSGHVDGFCIVSSDSDFTRLAARLREAGMYVVGMGEMKTPKPFVAACEKFKYLESLEMDVLDDSKEEKTKVAPQVERENKRRLKELKEAVTRIITEISDEDGWAFMADVGNVLNKRNPDFDVRNYGFSKLTPLLASLHAFEIASRSTTGANVAQKLIRIRDRSGANGKGRRMEVS